MMNERIEKLVAEAFFDESTNGPDEKMYTLGERKMQLFAELIVRECAKLADESTSRPFQSYGVMIKEHFGVEE